LHVERQRAADAAVAADGVRPRLPGLVPLAGAAEVELALGAQRSGGTDGDAVAAVDAGRGGERDVPLGRDPGLEAAAGDGDGEGVLGVEAAGLDAFVAEHALAV